MDDSAAGPKGPRIQQAVASRTVSAEGTEYLVHFFGDGRAEKILRLSGDGNRRSERLIWDRSKPPGRKTLAILRLAGCVVEEMRLPADGTDPG